ncbi:MAG: DUF3488 domain-containing protein [Planctomycetes bacterium]|nr:DUF3488 domain-containing protein [Planctomycetota bacterium]
MAELLRPWLVAIVLLNVAFVQITGAVSAFWVGPLCALAAAAPWLRRLQHHRPYRLLWNAAVIVVFGILVLHARERLSQRLLEDGLILALLCQVHLLNNLGPRQKPDLLFFNSFLIAFVTAFFCEDLLYLLVFTLYALLLLPSIQLAALLDGAAVEPGVAPGPARPSPAAVRGALRGGLPRTAVAIAVTAAVFLTWPRDFRREGWVGETGALQQTGLGAAAFADTVRPGSGGTNALDEREVLRVRPVRGDAATIPALWRSRTFVDFDGRNGWQAEKKPQKPGRAMFDARWLVARPGWWTRDGAPAEPDAPRVHVQIVDPLLRRIPVPLAGSAVQLLGPGAPEPVMPLIDGTLEHTQLGQDVRAYGSLDYMVLLGDRADGRAADLTLSQRGRLIRLPAGSVSADVLAIADRIRGRLPRDATDAELAAACVAHFAASYRYVLPGRPGAARDLEDFLLATHGGHCELFASALAVLLRRCGVPCRLVSGFRADGADASHGEIVVRRRHAHAWVEALLAGRGWVALDATPAADVDGDATGGSALERLADAIAALWKRVTAFDGDTRSGALAWLARLPRAVVARPRSAATVLGLLLALLGGLRWLRRDRRPRSIRELERCAARAGLARHPNETPSQLVARAATIAGIRPDALAALRSAVETHRRERYAGVDSQRSQGSSRATLRR